MKQEANQEVNYYEMEKTDKLCPLLSVVEMRQFGQLFYCVGEKCMWWQRICQSIEEQSHAEEPKTGQWIHPTTMKGIGNKDFFSECSECGEIVTDEPDYCPNCGAKMERSDVVIERSLCDSCVTKGCIFQAGIVRSHCDFYKPESEEEDTNGKE